MIFKPKRIYLDHASATPICSEVTKTIAKNVHLYANPSSLYSEGRAVNKVIDEARKSVAKILHSTADEIIFTSGATESNNLAILGVLDLFSKNHPNETPHIIVSSIEHSTILELVPVLKNKKIDVSVIDVDQSGVIDPKDIRDAIKKNTVLISVMYANNEIGTIQPIKEISKMIRNYKKHNETLDINYPIFHTDAAQAANYLSLDVADLGVDLLSLDGGKIYGMKGTGCLFKKKKIGLIPQMLGGGQENGYRSGTENVLAITSFAKALEIATSIKDSEYVRLAELQKYFFKELTVIDNLSVNGSLEQRLPNNISICIKGLNAEFVVYCLDELGVSSSSASTCMNNKEDSYSYVIKNIRPQANCETSSLRFTMGRTTTKKEINDCIKILKKVLLTQWKI